MYGLTYDFKVVEKAHSKLLKISRFQVSLAQLATGAAPP